MSIDDRVDLGATIGPSEEDAKLEEGIAERSERPRGNTPGS